MRPMLALLLAALAALAGCSVVVPPPLDAGHFARVDPEAAWARVLERFVDEHGRVDFAGLARDSADLDAYVAWIARVRPDESPALFPDRDALLAWYVNSYNALAMYNVLHAGVLPEDPVAFFWVRELRVGGSWISLHGYENRVIRALGESRVHFALNCMSRGCPRLPRVPFRAERLGDQLDAAAREFFGEARNVVVDAERRVVRFNQILDFYTSDFLRDAPTLIDYANRYRASKIPPDYEVEFIPYDFGLNAQ